MQSTNKYNKVQQDQPNMQARPSRPQEPRKTQDSKTPGRGNMPGARNTHSQNKAMGNAADRAQEGSGKRAGQRNMAPESNEDLMGSGKRQDDN